MITDENIIEVQQRTLENVFGRVALDAYGIGYALVQVKKDD